MRLNGCLSDIEFYSNPHDPSAIYAEVIVPKILSGGDEYTMLVEFDDPKLKSYLRACVKPKVDEKTTVPMILETAKDILTFRSNPDKVSPSVRTTGSLTDGLIEYDLNNDAREYIRITTSGWVVSKKAKHKFLKRNTMATQVTPQQTNTDLLTLLSPFINTDRDSFILFTTWLVQAFCKGSHSAAIIKAPQGSGKSTLTKMARALIDPSRLDASVMSMKKDDLFTTLSNSYFLAFDNLGEEFSKEVSDILCAAITGATIAKRMLYTTNELGVYELHNTLIINGIDIIPTESDLASRCLLFNLKGIDENKRRPILEIESQFASALPEIMGAIFNTLSQAMRILPNLHPSKLPRMADSYKEMLAISIALGISEEDFCKIYSDNLYLIDKERSNIAIVQAIKEFMSSDCVKGRSIEDKVTNLYSKIYASYSGHKSDLPKSASHFSQKVKREARALNAAGIVCNFDDTYSDGTHLKIIKNK